MKVFIVTNGYYESYHIAGVFSTKENAEKYIESNPDYLGDYSTEIEEYDMDTEA